MRDNHGACDAMSQNQIIFLIGLGLFLAAGGLLAFGRTPFGTTAAVAGLGLMLWSWFQREEDED